MVSDFLKLGDVVRIDLVAEICAGADDIFLALYESCPVACPSACQPRTFFCVSVLVEHHQTDVRDERLVGVRCLCGHISACEAYC